MSQIKKGLHYDPPKPDIDDILYELVASTDEVAPDKAYAKARKALYQRLADEAVDVQIPDHELETYVSGQAIPLSKLKAIMEIKE